MESQKYFHETYGQCREAFKANLSLLQSRWNKASADRFDINVPDEDLSIDVINAPAEDSNDKLLILTSGEHGIEGYLGSALINLFCEEFINSLDPKNTGILLVHAINPYGMKYHRKSNENNVDINRNFVADWNTLDSQLNSDYKKAVSFFQPSSRYGAAVLENLKLAAGFLKAIKSIGISSVERAITLGQYEFEKGLYYGGTGFEPSTLYMKRLYETIPAQYKSVVHLDLHTGYGPANDMSIVNSRYEKRTSEQLKELFGYPQILKTDAQEFYEINGDMIDYMYKLFSSSFPEKHLYSTTFEFGTIGDRTIDSLKTLKIIINENRLNFFGASSEKNAAKIKAEIDMLYAPKDTAWRENAAEKFRQAASGVLKAEGFIE